MAVHSRTQQSVDSLCTTGTRGTRATTFFGSCSHTNVSKRPVLHQAIERDDLRENKAEQGVRIDASRMRMWIYIYMHYIGFSLWMCAGVRSCIHVRIIVIDAQHTITTHFATYVKGHQYYTVHFRLIISRDHRNVGETHLVQAGLPDSSTQTTFRKYATVNRPKWWGHLLREDPHDVCKTVLSLFLPHQRSPLTKHIQTVNTFVPIFDYLCILTCILWIFQGNQNQTLTCI